MSVTIKIFSDCAETDVVQSSETAVPISAVMAFAAETPPDGWLVCDGSAISRTDYADLFAAIGTVWGEGDATTTFNLPDLRGEFVRGYDAGRGVDAGRVFASLQQDAMQNHDHRLGEMDAQSGTNRTTGAVGGSDYNQAAIDDRKTSNLTSSPYRYAEETRPRNIAMTYAIKAFYPTSA